MNKHSFYRKPLAILLTICLLLPGMAFGAGKSGKKNFNAGVKYEVAEQWDLAAQEFALAVAAEPSNAEYRLHLSRSLMNAAVMFIKRGDSLAEQNDLQSAYNAYRQAYSYDPTNEMARVKMNNIIERQKALSGIGRPANYNQIGNAMPVSGEVNVQQKPRSKDVMQLFEYKDSSLKTAILQTSKQLGLNVLFDDSFKEPTGKFSISLHNTTMAKAFDYMLLVNKLAFEQLDRRTIIIYADTPTNRQRFDKMMVKTFYLGNADGTEMRNLLTQFMQPVGGVPRQIAFVKQLNAMVVRAPLGDLKMIQDLIESLDKNRPEVMLDINIYEVSNTSSLAIGNQLATSALPVTETRFGTDGKPITVQVGSSSSLGNLGGIGRAGVAGLAGNIATPFLGGVGTVFGLPPTSLSLLQTKGNSKLLANAQVHALDGEAGQTVVGRSVPVRTGTNYVPGYTTTPGTATAPGTAASALQQGLGGGAGSGAFDNIQYKDVGLVIDMTPKITNEGYVEVKMKLESSNVEASGADSTLTPSFTKRQLTTIARVQDGQTAVVAGVKQESKGDSRATIPILGMVPILGRFLTTPQQSSQLTDIIITVTPHIIRSAEIKPEDHLARVSGTGASGLTSSIEDVIIRAQAEDDQDRRIIAMQQQQQQQQMAQQQSLPGAPLGQTLSGAAQIAETTAPSLNPMPKVDTPNFSMPAPAPVNTVATSGTISPNGLTPPPTVGAFQPEPNNATRTPMQNVNLINTTPTSAPSGSSSSVKSGPTIPVESSSISNMLEQAAPRPPAGQSPSTAPANGGINGNPPPKASQYLSLPNGAAAPGGAVAPAQIKGVNTRPVSSGTNQNTAKEQEAARKTKTVEGAETKIPDEYLPIAEGPKEPVQAASVKMRPALKTKEESEGSDSANPVAAKAKPKPVAPKRTAEGEMLVELSLLCQPKQQVGKSFIVVVSLNGEAQMTGASVSLKYDAAKLQLKAVRNGELLGTQAEVTHQDSGGNLTINVQQAEDKTAPVAANGKLVVVEFTALEEGETSLDFNSAETQLKFANDASAKVTAAPTKLEIIREAISKLGK